MAVGLTIDAVAKGPLSWFLSQSANRRGTLAFKIQSNDGSYVPALDKKVVMSENGSPVFGGLIDHVSLAYAGAVSSNAVISDCSAGDFNIYAERLTISIDLPTGSLESMLTILVDDHLNPEYGVTLHASQVTGPTLPDLNYTHKTIAEILSDLMDRTAEFGEIFVWGIDAVEVLRAYQPSTSAAPFNLASPYPQVLSDVVVETHRGSDYANHVTVIVPPTRQDARVETFTGDGTTDEFFLAFVLVGWRGYVNYLGNNETLDYAGQGATWEYDPVANSITRTTGAPANAEIITINYDGTFSAEVVAQDAGAIAAVGRVDRVFILDVIPIEGTVQALADSYLAKLLETPKTVTYTTREPGLLPGQSQTITVSNRGLTAVTGTITAVSGQDAELGRVIQRTITVTVDGSQTNLGRDEADVYRRWLGETQLPRVSGATIGGGTVGGGGSGTAGDTYVQKLADETLNNNDTLQNDNHLFYPVAANCDYWFELVLLHGSPSSAADFKLKWTVPSGTTMLWGGNSSTGANFQPTNQATIPNHLVTEADTVILGSTTLLSEPFGAIFCGFVRASSTAGTVQLQWAQNAATVGDSTLFENSFIRYRKISP